MIEEALAAIVAAHVAPLIAELRELRGEIVSLREALPPMLVSVAEARRRLGVSESTARRRIKDGTWPVRRDGRRVLVDLGALRPISEAEITTLTAAARAEEGRSR